MIIQLVVKFMLALLLSIIFSVRADARMFPQQIPVPAICWDSFDEAVTYHKDVLREYPIGRGIINHPNGPTFATIVVNFKKPSWSFLHFHINIETGKQLVCAMAGGSEWEIIEIPDSEEIEI